MDRPMLFRCSRLKKIFFRCAYRGTREVEILLGSFARAHLHRLSEDQLDAFEHLLEQSDADLHAWITGRSPPPDHVDGRLITRIADLGRRS